LPIFFAILSADPIEMLERPSFCAIFARTGRIIAMSAALRVPNNPAAPAGTRAATGCACGLETVGPDETTGINDALGAVACVSALPAT
jgi:hypothetical protein